MSLVFHSHIRYSLSNTCRDEDPDCPGRPGGADWQVRGRGWRDQRRHGAGGEGLEGRAREAWGGQAHDGGCPCTLPLISTTSPSTVSERTPPSFLPFFLYVSFYFWYPNKHSTFDYCLMNKTITECVLEKSLWNVANNTKCLRKCPALIMFIVLRLGWTTLHFTFVCTTFQIEHFSDMKLYLIFVDKNHINIFVVDYLLSMNWLDNSFSLFASSYECFLSNFHCK